MNQTRSVLGGAIAALLSLVPATSWAQNHPGLDAPGFQQNRDYFSEMPFENIDTLSGSVILTFTDLVLPGNAGRELKFQRTYNSKTTKWTFGVVGIPLTIAEAARPTLDTPALQEMTPALHFSDGSVRKMAWFNGPNINDPDSFDVTITSDFWKLNRDTGTLYIPNGDICVYEADSVALMLRVDHCTDTFGNDIDFLWELAENPPRLRVFQEVGSDSREIVITLLSGQGAASRLWDSLTYDERIWDYGYDPGLTIVSPPAGPGWTFAYDGNELVWLQTPRGGIIEYTFGDQFYEGPDSPPPYQTRVLRTRETSGSGIEPGTWTYDEYTIGLNGVSGITKVLTPSGRVTYTYGTNDSPLSVFEADGGVLPLVSKVVEQQNGSNWDELEREERTYTIVPVVSWSPIGVLELSTRTITRDGGGTTFLTEFDYDNQNNFGSHFGNYHQPREIEDTGTAGTRKTTRTFQHSTISPYLLGLPLTESVQVGSETFNQSWEYTASTGFKTSETIHGFKTTFTQGEFGNVRTVIKANSKWTQFDYQHGQVLAITTPEHTTTRTINADGTIASQTVAGRTTAFGYDDSGRLEFVDPPGDTHSTVIDYHVDGEWVKTTRGSAVSHVYFDGFGRNTGTQSPESVQTRNVYDEEGRLVYEGYPFRLGAGNGDIGVTVARDAIGRVTSRTHPGGGTTTYTYGLSGQVTVQEETLPPQSRFIVQTWKAFGDPDAARLAEIVDANGHPWFYSYNALDRLVGVNDGSVTRTWTYDSVRNLLMSENHPESGVTSYTYDDAGVLKTRTDAKGITTSYAYDGNDRIKTITASGRETMVIYEPGSDRRLAAVNPFAGIRWHYDIVTGRLQSRQDRIGEKAFTTYFEYDSNDRLIALTHPSGRRVEFVVNEAGQPTRIFETATNRDYASAITYHASGGVKSYTAGNKTTTQIEYDADRYWITSLVSGPLDLTYANYDRVGNPRTIADGRSGFSQTLTYDVLDRLTSASGVWGGPTPYGYDAYGNRSGDGYQVDVNTQRLLNQHDVVFTYDNNGNALTIGSRAFSYTPQNQVETAAAPGITETYAYDADDQRVKKTDGTTTTYYIRGDGGQLLTEWKDPGTANGHIRDYIYLGSHLVSAVSRDSTDDPTGFNIPSTPSHRYATSWQVPDGSGGGGNALIQTGVSAAARKSMHPDMPSTGLRLGVQTAGSVDTIVTGPLFVGTNPLDTKQGGVFLEFEVERYPSSTDAEWLATDGGGQQSSSTDDLRLYITSSGQLVLKHHGGRSTPLTLWTSNPVGLHTPHTLELRFEYNSYEGTYALPNPPWESLTSWAQLVFDGQPVAAYGASPGGTWVSEESQPTALDLRNGSGTLVSTKLKSPGPTNGLLMNVWRAGATAAQNTGGTIGVYGSSWRTTLLQAAGPGTYAEWGGGQSDWRARSIIAGMNRFDDAATTSTAGQKLSYRMESMLSRGITGHIATVLVGIRMQSVSSNTRPFIRRNGVETILTDMVLGANDNRWYRVANAGWSATDVIEVGVTSGDNASNWLHAVALLVEHDTPEPVPLTDTTARVMTYSYAGNGAAQTIDLGLDMLPTALIVMALNGPAGSEPIWWWESRQGAAPMADSLPSFGRIWPQKGKLHVVHTPSNSYNIAGVNYVVVALFDPSGRYVIPFAVSKPAADDNYIHSLRYPQSRQLASDFTPDFVFGGAAFGVSSSSVVSSFYKGPGHVGDSTAKLGPALPQASDADRIQALGAGTVEFGTLISHGAGGGDYAFWAGRVYDGVSPTRLMAVTSYVGDGTASRNISLDLSGQSPVLAFVVPTDATEKAYRVVGDTTGRRTASGNPLNSSITAMAADQITVGLALNAVGVTYDVWTITTGFVAPK